MQATGEKGVHEHVFGPLTQKGDHGLKKLGVENTKSGDYHKHEKNVFDRSLPLVVFP